MGPGYLAPLLGQRAPLWLPGLVWSLGPWLRLRSRPTRAHRGGPLPGVQDRLAACALGGCGSGWVHPIGQVGLQCSMWPKDGSTTPPQASATAGLWEGPVQQGVCAGQGLGRGLVLCHPGLPLGTTALARPHGRCGSCGLDPERQEDHCILEASALASIRIVR